MNVNKFATFMICSIAAMSLVTLAFREPGFEKSNKNNIRKVTSDLPVTPDTIDFAGEKVPLERREVKEFMDRELLFNYYNKANIRHTLKVASRYFPVIEARLKANRVPDDFKYLCVAESNLEPTARSRSGAISFWQFMDGTGPGYQLTINPQIDQRYDLERATDAACKYFNTAYQLFGNWTAAAASFNCGMGGYGRQATFQKSKVFYDLYLPEETNRYIFRILTFKHLLSNAQALGFNLSEDEKYRPVPFKTIEVKSSIADLAVFAIQNGTSYKMLKLLNPWIRGQAITLAAGKTLSIKLPQ